MVSIKSLIGLAVSGCIGLLCLVIACALPTFNNWYPLFVLIFYFLSPLPLSIAGKYEDQSTSSSSWHDFALFVTAGIVVSAFSLPIVLAHAPFAAPVIQWGACALTVAANIICFATILAYRIIYKDEDATYGMF